MSLLYLTGLHRYRRDLQEFGKALGQFHEVTKRHGLFLGAFAGLYFGWLTGESEGPKQLIAGFRAYGTVLAMPMIAALGALWLAHAGFDRLFGYGLKSTRGFGITHLGTIGKHGTDPSA